MTAILKPALLASLACLTLTAPAVLAQSPVDDVARALETEQMQRLAIQQSRPGITIDAFNSDGCSGGMSRTWSYLADTLPEFSRYIGKQPPWEHCCVEHDRAYWRGETTAGYDQRQRADADLRSCVQATGRKNADEITRVLGLSRKEVIDMIDLTAELMYLAVRLGGGPCTGLAWRWGHGWPPCDSPTDPVTDPVLLTSEIFSTG